ncbi:MAG: hypothetical protein HC802_12840 [Caldilineaceae bacterium]|nr:hypothetical protein [Caldilineaceae bacterium]
MLLIDHPARFIAQRPDEWRTTRAILNDAIRQWGAQGVPFYVLLRGARRTADDIPRL